MSDPKDGVPDDDEDREAILARRARFVATALLGISVLPGCDPFASSRPCLSVERVAPDAGQEPAPQPCLSPMPDPPPSASGDAPPQPCLEIAPAPPPTTSSSADAPPDAGPPDAGPPKAPPQPCLSIARPPPPPAPCLTPVRPKGQ